MHRIICRVAIPAFGLSVAMTLGGCRGEVHIDRSDAFIDPQTGLSPEQADKSAMLRAAVRGLDFDTGRVVVRPNGRNNPDRAMDLYQDGLDAYDENRPFDAITSMRKAVQTAPNLAIPYDGLGRTLHLRGKTDWAIASFRTALDLSPQFTEARQNLAMALSMADEMDEAIAEMDFVVAEEPDNVFAHERLAIWNYYLGNYEIAWDHVHAAQALGHEMPGQFIVLLEGQMPDPGVGG